MALRSGKLVQCSLINGARSFAQQLGDVVSLLETAPDAKVMLCMPLMADEERQRSGRVLQGALLLGLNLDYCLSKRCVGRQAAAAGARAMLSSGMARHGATYTLAGVICMPAT